MWSFGYPIEDQYYAAPIPRITIPQEASCALPELPLSSVETEAMGEIPFLVNYLDGTRSPDESRFWMAYDTNAFIIAGKLSRPSHHRTDIVEDQLEHEQLHIVINPTPGKKRGFRIRLRPESVVSIDAGGEDAPKSWWDEDGQLEQMVEEDGWEFAVRIPFRLLGVQCPHTGQIWRINFFRYEYKRQEDNSSWSVMYLGRIDIPERYGEVAFGGDGLAAGILSTSVGPGMSSASFWVDNPDSRPRDVSIEVLASGQILYRSRHRASPGRGACDLQFMMRDGGDVLLTLREDDEEIARWPANPGCRPIREDIARLRTRVSDARGSGSVPIRRTAAQLMAALGDLEDSISGGADATSWPALEARFGEIEEKAAVLALRSGLNCPDAPNAILATHTLMKIKPGRPLPPLADRVQLAAPRRGSDSCQIVVLAFDGGLRGCRVEVERLVGPGSTELDPANMEVWHVGYVTTRRPRYTIEDVGAHPDPLLPLNDFDVAEGGYEVLWLTINAHQSLPAGDCRGLVRITPQNADDLELPIEMKIWNYELPIRSTLRTAFPMFEREIEKFYGRPLSPETRRQYYEFLLRRRISPSCQYEEEARPRAEDLDFAMEKGSNVISMGYFPQNREEEWVAALRPTVELLRENGWLGWAYVYGFDEVTPPGYPELKSAYGRAKQVYPDLPRGCTIGPEHDLAELYGVVDIWIPQTDRFVQAYKHRQLQGDELWWYVSMWPRHPFANMFIDYPAIDHRVLFWQTWKYGVTGFLYYCINLWSSNCRGQPSLEHEVAALPNPEHRAAVEKGARWPEVPWNTYTGPTATNGDGQMIYPGPDGGPLSSVRLECVRHGIEDYEMLAKLRSEAERVADSPEARPLLEEARRLLEIPTKLCQDLTTYTSDPDVLLRTRAEIGDLTERLSSL